MEEQIYYDEVALEILLRSQALAKEWGHSCVLPEHVLLSAAENAVYRHVFAPFPNLLSELRKSVESYEYPEPKFFSYPWFPPGLAPLLELMSLCKRAIERVAGAREVSFADILNELFESVHFRMFFLQSLLEEYMPRGEWLRQVLDATDAWRLGMEPDTFADPLQDPGDEEDDDAPAESDAMDFLSDAKGQVDRHPRLIGREREMRDMMRVLCRRDKGNVMLLGLPGVGKTAMAYGLARMVKEGKVPRRLCDARIYMLDSTALLAGTQYRGDYEKRVIRMIRQLEQEACAGTFVILFIDEIQGIIGAGTVEGQQLDLSAMLRPMLDRALVHVIGTTTPDEYKRTFERLKAISRRFTMVDVPEPSADEAVEILRGVKDLYEDYHDVVYPDETLDFAVRASQKYINDRYLPDKAIDLLDQAGAWMHLQGCPDGADVTKDHISQVLARVCNVETLADITDSRAGADEFPNPEALLRAMQKCVFGQDQALRQVNDAVMLNRAGLTDDHKPVASMLFVGPTGVGKTEVARVLARELGVELIRFDMSEYVEKHTVARLIGSPPGYVGYDDGGLLTDAVRRQPRCVLLLDEIEKAHSDIFNLLLQVMDYATLTDSHGVKTDFRHVVLIMTSNAGAQFASQAGMGFVRTVSTGQAMLKAVKARFKPEFLGRLTSTVVFNDLSLDMAERILKKKIGELAVKVKAKGLKLNVLPSARKLLLEAGFTPERGARELDRVIARMLKPVIMRAIIYSPRPADGVLRIRPADLITDQTR